MTVNVRYWGRSEDAVQFADGNGVKLEAKEAIRLLRDSSDLSAREIGRKLGVEMRTVHGWLVGRPVNIKSALAIQAMLKEDPLFSLLVQTKNSPDIQSGECSHPSEASATKVVKPKSSTGNK